MITIYHNPHCSKSRQTVALLQQAGEEYQVVKYLEEPAPEAVLRQALAQLGREALLRKGEAAYKEHVAGRELDDDALVALLRKHPILMERPLVSDGRHIILGRPPENVNQLIKQT